jgi:hypothetical protein
MTEQIWIIGASGWLFKEKSIMMRGNVNVKLENAFRTFYSLTPKFKFMGGNQTCALLINLFSLTARDLVH